MGTFGLASKVVPMPMSGAGTDSFTDIGVDTQRQYLGNPHTVTVRAAWIHENIHLDHVLIRAGKSLFEFEFEGA